MKVVILTPVFNDWASLSQLVSHIKQVMSEVDVGYSILAVNDDSSEPPDLSGLDVPCKVLNLTCNLGHQRAIAIGLAQLSDAEEFDAVIVMDADGEDKPEYIPELIAKYQQSPEAIVVARRDKRSESGTFRLGYNLYRMMFRLCTGRNLRFGNFCLIPRLAAQRLVFQESIWNHMAATILRSRFELIMLPTERGERFSGQTSMNFGSLILLGLSAVSVYVDVAVLRILFGSFFLGAVAITGIVAAIAIRLLTDAAIPGWASTVVGSMVIILVQSVIVSVLLLFVMLSNRSQRGFVAARHYQEYVLNVTNV